MKAEDIKIKLPKKEKRIERFFLNCTKRKKFISISKEEYIIALKYYKLIKEDLFKELLDLNDALADVLGLDLTFQLRKLSQYDVNEWENIKEEDASLTVSIARKIISYVENETSK